ncbi:MAG: ribosome silencing factor [Algisphaera sp.]
MTTSAEDFLTRSPERPDPNPGKAPDALAYVAEIGLLLKDRHCENIVALDVRGISPLTQVVIVASGTSDRQIKALADEVAEEAAVAGFPSFGGDKDGASTWVVLDLVDIMVHLFEPATRAHYDLEKLWADAPRIELPSR